MPPGMQQPVFSLSGDIFTWQDVRAHAEATGAWSELEQVAREGVACELLADNGEEVDEDAIEAAAEEFRYDRDLVTAAEMEAWLAAGGVTAEEWMGHVRRTFLRLEWAGQLDEIVAEQEPDAALVARALEVDLACTGGRAELSRRLAEDAASAAALRAAEGPGDEPPPRDMARIVDEAARYHGTLATDDAVAREVSAAHMDWIRVDCQALAFEGEDEAREAALCLRDDGEALDDLARDARIEVQDVGFYLNDIDLDRRALFLSARVGEVVGPIPEDALYAIYQVSAKTLPTAGDPDIVERARAAIIARQVEAEVNLRVQWHADAQAQ